MIYDVAQTSTTAYFEQVVCLSTHGDIGVWIRGPSLAGYVTSAGAGSETVLRASREAFTIHANRIEKGMLGILCTVIVGLLKKGFTAEERTANDRLNIPTLEFLAFLCDSGILHRLSEAEFECVQP